MLKIIMHGSNGAMGRVISELVKENKDMQIIAGVDLNTEKLYDFPVYENIFDIKEAADVIIDFANVKAVDKLLDFTLLSKTPLVLCTTGLSTEQIYRVNEISKEVPVLRSANMSLGINLLSDLAAKAAKVLACADFDIEIVEKHHKRKLDAPSGTAILLADSINKALDDSYKYTYERASKHEKRAADEIGISSIRGGNIVGEHEVIYAGEDELITISHAAYSRKVFAKGALSAAEYIADKKSGLYTMKNVINAD